MDNRSIQGKGEQELEMLNRQTGNRQARPNHQFGDLSNINIQNNPNSDPNKVTGTHSSVSSDDISILGERPFDIKEYYDYDSFPESKGFSILPWQCFTRDFEGIDLKINSEISHLCETHLEKLVDLRPYMIENPETCTKFDFLPKILSRFRNQHLRHLIVVNPTTGWLEGMITRQDIFAYMPL